MTQRKTFVKTKLAPDDLLLHGLQGQEGLSRPFVFNLTLFNDVEKKPAIDQVALLGSVMTVHLDQEFSADPRAPQKPKRYFHGHVTNVMFEGIVAAQYRLYRVELRPWLWLLDKTSNCRIFQKMTVPAIVQDIFAKNGFSHFEMKLGAYQPREYCVQYRETDLAFVSRLLEDEGIYYYFRHDQDKHTLVLADGSAPPTPLPQYGTIEYFPGENYRDTKESLGGRIYAWRPVQQVRSGSYALKDYDFEKPSLPLNARLNGPKHNEQGKFERFDYPGGYAQAPRGDRYAEIRLQEEQTFFDTVQGDGTSHGLAPGSTFTLAKHPVAEQNVERLVVSATYDFALEPHKATKDLVGRGFQCTFTALKSSTRFRPARLTPRPAIAGLQTAKVVGPQGEEIWTDQYGRVKVQFHWDREGKFDVNSSCWIRVAQAWAGGSWGVQHVPRIGNEVVVSFLEGDPDRPLIVGSVYNGTNSPPFKLPGKQQVSGIKTDSTKNATGYNELSFDDTSAKELITLHAQRDMKSTIENDLEDIVRNDRRTTVGNNDSEMVGGDQAVTVTKRYSLDAQEVEITCGASSILMTSTGIVITSPAITLTAVKGVTVTGATVQIMGDTTIPVLHAIPLPPKPPIPAV